MAAEAKSMAADARASLRKADQLIGSVNGLALKLDERVDTLTHAVASIEEVGVTARAVGEDTMPRMNVLLDDLSKETRALGRVINTVGEHPQSLIFRCAAGHTRPGRARFRGPTIMLRAALLLSLSRACRLRRPASARWRSQL